MEFLNRRTSDVYSCYNKTCIRRARTPLDGSLEWPIEE